MTNLPDWLVERAALEEVGPHSQARVAEADPAMLAERVAALHDDNARELARHPAGPAVAQIELQIEREAAKRRRMRQRLAGLGIAVSAAGALLLVTHTPTHVSTPSGAREPDEVTRIKGTARLLAFRQAGHEAERLGQDALVHAGDLLQLRYSAGSQRYGVIASIDGAGGVTLHYPLRDDAPPEATVMASETTTLPNSFALDDAPRFERFFLFTADGPIDVQQTLAALHALTQRADSATVELTLPQGMHQWSLRLRKPTHESP